MPNFDYLFGFLGASVVAVFLVLYAVILMFPLVYVILRWRAADSERPGLGTRATVLFLRSLTILTLLTGAALLLQTIFSQEMNTATISSMRRIAMGLGVGAGVLLAFQQVALLVLPRVGLGEDPARRVFRGVVAIVTGIVSSIMVIVLCVRIFEEGDNAESILHLYSWLVVWWPAHIVILFALGSEARRLNPEAAVLPLSAGRASHKSSGPIED